MAAKLQHEQLNPKTYKQFFKAYRAEQASKYSDLGWEKTACPVELVTSACERCGVDDSCRGRQSLRSEEVREVHGSELLQQVSHDSISVCA